MSNDINVDVLDHTNHPERTICAAARGDYRDDSLTNIDIGFIDDYHSVMEGVDYDEELVQRFERNDPLYDSSYRPKVKAQTYSLLEQLMERGHYGVFEHASITFAIEGISRPCMAQLTRHRHASFDVQSQRYCSFDDASVKRPPSILEDNESTVSRDDGLTDLDDGRQAVYDDAVETAIDAYNDLRDKGVPKEDARFILPEGTMVNLSVTVNVRTLLHIANLRAKADSQWEIRELTEQLLTAAEDVVPMTMELWDEQTPMTISP